MRVETNKFGHIHGLEHFISRKEFVVNGLAAVKQIRREQWQGTRPVWGGGGGGKGPRFLNQEKGGGGHWGGKL